MSQVFGLPVSTITGLPCLKTIPQVRNFEVIDLRQCNFSRHAEKATHDKILLLNLLIHILLLSDQLPKLRTNSGSKQVCSSPTEVQIEKKKVQYIIGLNQVCSPPRKVHGNGQKLKQSCK